MDIFHCDITNNPLANTAFNCVWGSEGLFWNTGFYRSNRLLLHGQATRGSLVKSCNTAFVSVSVYFFFTFKNYLFSKYSSYHNLLQMIRDQSFINSRGWGRAVTFL